MVYCTIRKTTPKNPSIGINKIYNGWNKITKFINDFATHDMAAGWEQPLEEKYLDVNKIGRNSNLMFPRAIWAYNGQTF